MSGEVPPSLTATFSFNQSHSGKLNIPIPRSDLFKSRSLMYSGSVLWNSLPDSLRLPPSTETFKSRYMSYIMRCLVGIACYIWWLLPAWNVLPYCVSHLSRIYPPNVCCWWFHSPMYPPSFLPVSYHVWRLNFIYSMCVLVCRSLENVYMYN